MHVHGASEVLAEESGGVSLVSLQGMSESSLAKSF